MLILSFGCLRFLRESCLLYTFLLGYLPSIFCDFGEKPIDFYLQDSFCVFSIGSGFAGYSLTASTLTPSGMTTTLASRPFIW